MLNVLEQTVEGASGAHTADRRGKSKTAFAFDEAFLAHDTGPGHPERPDRLRSLVAELKARNLAPAPLLIEPAPEAALLAVHTPRHVNFVRDACLSGRSILDGGDTHACAQSWDAALRAAGAGIAAVDAVVAGTAPNAFCAVRPPGHHAESDRVMGFCLLNNIAVAARHALDRHGLGRVAIVDWDVHHGNGTQEIFYRSAEVYYFSLHQYPWYPGTGAADERGEGDGAGRTMNIPLAAGSGPDDYFAKFRSAILPALDSFKPELIMISAGFDAHIADPLGGMRLDDAAFGEMTSMLMEAAGRHCGCRIVSMLEGGYNLDALASSAAVHLETLGRA